MDRSKLLIYTITDRKCIGKRDLYEAVEKALRGGARTVQLREKELNENELIKEAVQLKKLCEKYGALLIINDNYKAALKAGADGVHVGIEDAPVSEIRKTAPKGFIIGATAKTVEQAQLAEASGADYLGVGALFPSPTKKNAVRITSDDFRKIAASVNIPAVAIGGIDKDNIRSLKGIGAVGAALVSAVFGAEDIEAAAALMKKLCQEVFDNE